MAHYMYPPDCDQTELILYLENLLFVRGRTTVRCSMLLWHYNMRYVQPMLGQSAG